MYADIPLGKNGQLEREKGKRAGGREKRGVTQLDNKYKYTALNAGEMREALNIFLPLPLISSLPNIAQR